MDYVFLQVAFEILERLPLASNVSLAAPVELVLDVAEELFGGGIVDAVRLPGHALDDAGGLEPGCVRGVLVLPAPVQMHGRGGTLGNLGQQLVEHPDLLAHDGRVDMSLAKISLVQKSSVGAQQALPPATLNSVTSVPSFRHGAPALKYLADTFSNVLPTTPLYELYLW